MFWRERRTFWTGKVLPTWSSDEKDSFKELHLSHADIRHSSIYLTSTHQIPLTKKKCFRAKRRAVKDKCRRQQRAISSRRSSSYQLSAARPPSSSNSLASYRPTCGAFGNFRSLRPCFKMTIIFIFSLIWIVHHIFTIFVFALAIRRLPQRSYSSILHDL